MGKRERVWVSGWGRYERERERERREKRKEINENKKK